MLLAAASVAAIATGGAFVAAQVVAPDPSPSRPATPPAERPAPATATVRLVDRDGTDGSASHDDSPASRGERALDHDPAAPEAAGGGSRGDRSGQEPGSAPSNGARSGAEPATGHPTGHPTGQPTDHPTDHPTGPPSDRPTDPPTDQPPGDAPGDEPSEGPGDAGRMPGPAIEEPTPAPGPDRPFPDDQDEGEQTLQWWAAVPRAGDTLDRSSTWSQFVRETVSRRGPHHGARGVNGWQPRSTSSNVPASETLTPGVSSTSP
ncbi:hypothetical protein EKO23_10735 [Nocardioides guangzhouensis]|uniref:Uncharacterized protein n=2 Tax=Nocardioides guangzhouensis TaxID=2497878 RepID=A0A4Q4ZDL9_9ACTN|nr:hypothetical protein EKO23_10735 [Nocardioides guangzhouensis]